MHITLKKAELLKHSKLDKNTPTYFGLHRNHLQGAKISAWLKITHLVNIICVKDVQGVILKLRVHQYSPDDAAFTNRQTDEHCVTIKLRQL